MIGVGWWLLLGLLLLPSLGSGYASDFWKTKDEECALRRGLLWWEELSAGCESLKHAAYATVCGICTRRWHARDQMPQNQCYHRVFWERFVIDLNKTTNRQDCRLNEDHCKPMFFAVDPPSCSHHGRCISGFTSYRCTCDSPWYGRNCEYRASARTEDSYAHGVDVFYNKRVRVSDELTVIVVTYSSGEDIEVEVKSGLGKRRNLFRAVRTSPMVSDSTRVGDKLAGYCNTHTALSYTGACRRYLQGTAADLYSATMRFPFKRDASSDDRAVYYYRDSDSYDWPIGYVAIFEVNVYNTPSATGNKELVFSNFYNIWVDYPVDTYCYKSVGIANCDSELGVEKFYTTDTILFIGEYPNDQMPEQFEASNKLVCYRSSLEGDWKLLQNTADGSLNLITKVRGQMNFLIERLTLAPGIYRVEFSAKVMTEYGNRENFAVCTFRVMLVQIIALLSGGSEISVNVEEESTLDGSQSFDPNVDRRLSKEGLTYSWTCELVDTSEPCLVKDLSPGRIGLHSSVVKIPRFHFELKKKYRIKLEVSKVDRASARTSQVINVAVGTSVLSVHIECKVCFRLRGQLYADPASYIYLRATVKMTKKSENYIVSNFFWDYSEDNGYTYVSTHLIRVPGTSSDLLKIKDHELVEDKVYYFRVKPVESDMFAVLNVKMVKLDGYVCNIEPEEGTAGLTLFAMNCINFNGSANFAVYEVYDKLESDVTITFSGRMLGSRRINKTMKNFRLVNGNVVALLYTSQKVIRSHAIKVKLAPFNGTDRDVLSIVNLDDLFQQNRNERLLTTASVIPCVISKYKPSRYKIIENLFLTVYKVSIITSFMNITHNIKLGLSSISYTLDAMTSMSVDIMLEADVVKKCAKVLLSLAKMLLSKLSRGVENEITLNPSTIKDMVREVFTSVEILLAIKIPQATSKPLHLVNQGLLETIQDTSHDLVKVLYQSGGTLLWQQEPGDEASKVTSKQENIIGWVKENQNFTLIFERESNSNFPDPPISFSHEFQHFQSNFTLGTQLTTFKINPYWWGYNNINTHVLLLEMCRKNITSRGTCKRITHNYQHDVSFYFNITQQVSSLKAIEGQTTQLDPEKNPYDLDLNLTVYRFDPPIKAKLFVHFLELKPREEIRVLFTENTRPDFKMMSQSVNVRVINQESPVYNVTYDKTARDKFYYMGILPGENVPKGEVLKFKVKVYYVQCKTWLKFSWGGYGCWVGNSTVDNTLECVCNHFSLFGGRVGVPTNFLNPPIDYPIFLTESWNWLPVTLLVVTILIFIVFIVWSWLRDKKDSIKGLVMVLEDNYPGERYAYLLGVYTGSRVAASTDANVGVKLFGEKSDSRPHILKSSVRETLQGSDDWFLMYCPHQLGSLERLQIWHDNSGKSPDWFVERIVVFDLTNNCQYIFHLNVWIALEVDEYPEAIVAPVTMGEFFNVKQIFVENIIHGFRDTHYWTSVFWKHPRNPVSREERVCVLMCFVLVAMSVSLMFYIYFEGNVKEDIPVFSFLNSDLIIFFISFFIASLMECLLMFIFRKSFKHVYLKRKSSVFMGQESHGSETSSLLSLDKVSVKSYASLAENFFEERKSRMMKLSRKSLHEKYKHFSGVRKLPRDRTTFERLANTMYFLAQGSSLEPVRLPNYKSTLTKKWPFLILACVFSIIFVMTSVIVVAVFGFRLTYVKSEVWVTVLILLILFDGIIFQTLKVFLVSIILSFSYQRVVSPTYYNFKSSDGIQKHLIGNRAHLIKLLEMRIKPAYCPIDEESKEKFRAKRFKVMQWKLLIDFLVVLLLIFVLVMVTTLSISNHYLSNDHAASILMHAHDRRHPDFEDAINRTHLEDFLIYGFINQLYKSMWYNDFALNDQNGSERGIFWTDDGVVRLLGNARVRQLRMELGACPKIENTTLGEFCCPSWSPEAEAKDVYDMGWLTGGYKDRERKSSAWRYTGARHSNSSAGYGPTRTLYHAGGYIQDLGSTRADAVVAVSLLRAGGWLDHVTRAVFLELSLYNPNTDLFSQVILVAEFLPSGQVLTAAHVNSVDIRLSYNVWNISFVIFQLFFFVRMCVLMNRNGVFTYLSKLLNAFEVFLLGLGIFTVVLYLVHVVTSAAYVVKYNKSGKYQYFDFSKIIFYEYVTTTVFSVLFVFIVVRLLFSWRFGRIYFTFYYTITLSWAWVVWMTLYFVLYLYVVWRLVGYFIQVYIFSYSTTVVVYSKDFLASGGQIVQHQVMVYVMCMLSYLVVLIFVASFSYYYKVAKTQKLIDTDKFNFYTFVKDEVLSKLKKKKR